MGDISVKSIILKYYPNAIKDGGVDLDGNGKVGGNEKLLDAEKGLIRGMQASENDFWRFLERNKDLIKADLKNDAIALYKEKLSDPDYFIRYRAACNLGDLNVKEAVPGIIKSLNDPEKLVRMAAINALTKLKAKEAGTEIMKHLKDPDLLVRNMTIKALASLDIKEAIPAISKSLEFPDNMLYESALDSLRKLIAGEAVTDTMKLLKDANWEVRTIAIQSLVKLNAKEAMPEITKYQKDEEEVYKKVTKIIDEKLAISEKEVNRGASFINDFGADNLDMVEFVMGVQKEFNIEVPDLDAEKFSTVGDAVNYVVSQLNK